MVDLRKVLESRSSRTAVQNGPMAPRRSADDSDCESEEVTEQSIERLNFRGTPWEGEASVWRKAMRKPARSKSTSRPPRHRHEPDRRARSRANPRIFLK